jgi:HK97 gp10 family phage protein
MIAFQFPELNMLVRDLSSAPNEVKLGAAQAVRTVIRKVEATGRSIAPKRTGKLAKSISSEIILSLGGGAIIGEAGPTAKYGRFVEWGTYKDAPQAFMGPALDRHSHELDELLASAGANAIDSAYRGFVGALFGIDASE